MNQEFTVSNSHLLDEGLAEKVGVSNNINQQKTQRMNKIRKTAGLTDEDFARDQEMFDETEREKIEAESQRRSTEMNQQKEVQTEPKQTGGQVKKTVSSSTNKKEGCLRILGMKPVVGILVIAGASLAAYFGIKHFKKSKIKINELSESGVGSS